MDLKKRNQNFYTCDKKLKKYINNLEFLDINSCIKNLIENINFISSNKFI